MIEWVNSNLAIVISMLALIAAVSANRIAEKSRRYAVKADERSLAAEMAKNKTELLVETELKNSAVGNMLLITTRKIIHFQKNEHLAEKYPKELDRLLNNLELLQDLKVNEKEKREIAEKVVVTDIEKHEKMMSDLKRMRVSIENEAKKENEMYEVFIKENA